MKKFTLPAFLILIFFTTTTAFGQIDSYGIKIGTQLSGVYSNQYQVSRVAGFTIYGFVDINLTQRLFTTLDLGFTQRGFTNSQITTSSSGEKIRTSEATSRLSYVSLASFVNIKLSTSIPIYIGVGPRLDYLIGSSAGKYEFKQATIKDPLANELDNFVFGGSVVAGIKELSIGGVNFRIEAKYEVDITDSLGGAPFSYRNNALMLLFGVSL